MYGVLFAITPELFPTKARGTGNAITATANRIFGVMVRYFNCINYRLVDGRFHLQAPIVALYTDLTTPVPIFIAGGIFLVSGVLALFLPYESRGRASL